jgi:hypothetical protein
MSKIETSGPAFSAEIGPPSDGYMVQTGDRQWLHPGMTLRDYFAAKAMAVLLDAELPTTGYSIRLAADAAYGVADAMLFARAASTPQPPAAKHLA